MKLYIADEPTCFLTTDAYYCREMYIFRHTNGNVEDTFIKKKKKKEQPLEILRDSRMASDLQLQAVCHCSLFIMQSADPDQALRKEK